MAGAAVSWASSATAVAYGRRRSLTNATSLRVRRIRSEPLVSHDRSARHTDPRTE